MRILLITIGTLFLISIMVGYEIYISNTYNKYYEEQYSEHIRLFNEGYNLLSDKSFNGLYFGDLGYTVKTKGRSPLEQFGTEEHEICHDFVYKNYEHFCEEEVE